MLLESDGRSGDSRFPLEDPLGGGLQTTQGVVMGAFRAGREGSGALAAEMARRSSEES